MRGCTIVHPLIFIAMTCKKHIQYNIQNFVGNGKIKFCTKLVQNYKRQKVRAQ